MENNNPNQKQTMTIKFICSEIAKREGKKIQTPIGDIREIVGIVSDLIYAEDNVFEKLWNNGEKRAKRNGAKKLSFCGLLSPTSLRVQNTHPIRPKASEPEHFSFSTPSHTIEWRRW